MSYPLKLIRSLHFKKKIAQNQRFHQIARIMRPLKSPLCFMNRKQMKTFLTVATERITIITSLKVSFFVGSILALINYGDRIFLRRDMYVMDWVKIAVTYCVPYCVATYGAARYAVRKDRDK